MDYQDKAQIDYDREAAALDIAGTLEGKTLQVIEEGARMMKDGEPSDALKFMQDIILQTMAAQALKLSEYTKTDKDSGMEYQAWNELVAANMLGITHKQLQTAIKRFGILEPEIPEPQGELDFKEAA